MWCVADKYRDQANVYRIYLRAVIIWQGKVDSFMWLMDPNTDPIVRFAVFNELAKYREEVARSKPPRQPRHSKLKKLLILSLRKLGWRLVSLGYRLEEEQ